MSLTLHYHPLSSYCWKVLIALYENDTPFTPLRVDLGNADARAAFLKVWPIGKFPVLHDAARDRVVPESSIIIEYLDQHYPGRTRLIPSDADLARQQRLRDRFYDLYVHANMQKIVGDRLRPEGQHDVHGVEQARAQLRTACAMIEQDLAGKTWTMGEAFGMADCAALPALFYSDWLMPLAGEFPVCAAYLARLRARPAVARVIAEAEPYFHRVPT